MLVIFLFSLINILYIIFLKIIFKKLLNPLSIIILWWAFWVVISYAGLTDLYKPDEYVLLLVFLLNSGLLFGSFFGVFICSGRKYHKELYKFKDDIFENKIKKIFDKTYKIVLPIVLFFFLKAIYILATKGVEGYRGLTFSDGDNEGILFGNPYLEILYSLTISPYILFYLLVGVYLFIFKGEKKIFYVGSLLMFLESTMRLGRFGLYYILMMTFIAFILNPTKSKAIKTKFKKIILTFTLILLVVGGLRESNFGNVLYKSIFEYHTVGFTLLSNELDDPSSKLNNNMSYGMGTLGGMDYVSTLFIRRFSPTYDSHYSYMVKDHHLPVETGYDRNGYPIYHNAFYTMLFTLYADGREFFVFFIPLLIGVFMGFYYAKFKKTNYIFDFLIVLFFMFVFIFSLFQSMLQSHIVFLALMILLYIGRKVNKHKFDCK
ncbi:oligosaccharide repeat unit polymerase [Flavobacterium nitrogenifigens]|uniref:Oligosaccharide repeat unit polymerase n=2 Tax=Flavobacterium TaxID=237 RepID=A0A7W7J010_9FLAO|nr:MULTISPECIES: O-antigen polymerase [Flavobacterium]MBB4803678.1 oligosaccharide repeat unit polymerase [Flavobacterium nitrogenifigens]MBB6388517.1 oligosaccharide repeat unit polymerase [Flavobacterium notoginsengisoli]